MRTPVFSARFRTVSGIVPLLIFLVFLAWPLQVTSAPLRITLLLESGLDDGGAASLMRQGLDRAARTAGADARVTICPPGENQTAIFRQACETSDMVIVAEPRLHMLLRDNAANYRRVAFGCVDTGVRAPNIMSVTFADEEPAFLAGALSVMLLEKGRKLGFLEDEEGPVHDNILAAFLAGALVQAPDTRMLRRQTGFASPAGDAVREMAEAGAGLTVLACGYSTPAQLDNTAALGMLAVSTDAARFAQAPENVPFSIVKRYDRAVEELVTAMAAEDFKGKTILVYNLANGGVALELNPAFNGGKGLPGAARTRLQELTRELARGNIRLEDKRLRTLCDCLD